MFTQILPSAFFFAAPVIATLLVAYQFHNFYYIMRSYTKTRKVLPENNPNEDLMMMKKVQNIKLENQRTLVCVGDSITCGYASANYVHKIKFHTGHTPLNAHQWNIVNVGINSIPSFEVYRNIENIIESDPDYITILIGTNDIKGLFRTEWKVKTESFFKVELSFGTYEQNLIKIVSKLLERTNAIVALCTIPPIGEDLSSEANSLYVHKANEIVRTVATRDEFVKLKRVYLFDTNHELQKKITEFNKGRLFYPRVERFLTNMHLMLKLRSMFGLSWNMSSKLVLGLSYNVVLSDCIHLNESGADIIARTIIDGLISIVNSMHQD